MDSCERNAGTGDTLNGSEAWVKSGGRNTWRRNEIGTKAGKRSRKAKKRSEESYMIYRIGRTETILE